jgi:putative DNA methylase
MRLIEADSFPFEFLSKLGERESWRKEIHRPIYHVHKWWAKRLGSIFRGILLGCKLDERANLEHDFYLVHEPSETTVLDPFMGSGTTIGESHKLGFISFGRDINPVAASSVRVALGQLDTRKLESAFQTIERDMGSRIKALYRGEDALGQFDVLYYFWVMQASCPSCEKPVDLFSSYVFSQNAYPKKKPEVQILCPKCGEVFSGLYHEHRTACPSCSFAFDQTQGPAKGSKATCGDCCKEFTIGATIKSKKATRPTYRLYAKMVLRDDGNKCYLKANDEDFAAYRNCGQELGRQLKKKNIQIPDLELSDGYNTKQAIGYNFLAWKDFFNDRQLLALGLLHSAIQRIEDRAIRDAILTVFSGALEFNNMFASFKGEGTGAVRHMFSHHILKPERTPIEANVWGTPKSSGGFSGLFKNRLGRAAAYRAAPTEISENESAKVCSLPFTGSLAEWNSKSLRAERAIAISCGDSAKTELPDKCIDFVVTDPPFFDNVHYSELADFFHAWQQLSETTSQNASTRNSAEVQDGDSTQFARKLTDVFREANRVLKDDGLLVFSYHHSRAEGWESVGSAILDSGFVVRNAHPVKSEMSVAMPKSQATDPIQFDVIIVCQKRPAKWRPAKVPIAVESANDKINRLKEAGFKLTKNDQRVVLFGQLLTTVKSTSDLGKLDELASPRFA